ncbi:HEAT repeat domain-containing protein [Singulisphaera acidiphila]|uniref:HEAT repeat-containing protein n=1 Tax=Singulisphaera acidiphila (strain ATCC BAA-1392 / DSM 18658 / VKM B-2454 / MOB10) TaxID=886293 RepID=L0DL84_SINAD|nr:HEAT repeat domain-containing protein [Singulisphaera acidiphila]AGA29590.1 HEAT repeat-containing protein [Singulisphaera acidiphila DSM 18658]
MRIRGLSGILLVVSVYGPLAIRGMAQDGPTPGGSESAIEKLRAENVDVRRAAATQVRSADKSVQRKALPVLIDLLMQEKDGQVRLAVLDTVTALGPDAVSAIPALVHTLRTNYGGQGKEESHQDYRSALALAAIGKPAVEDLRGLLNERKENVRAEVVMGLGRIGPDAAAAIPDLLPLLGDKNERIRREATVALGRIGMAALEPLIAASTHQDVIIRARAIECLGPLSVLEEQAQAAILKGTHDEVPEVRAAALSALARSGLPDDALLPILVENLRQVDEQVRRAAVDCLVGRRALLIRMATELESLLTAEQEGVSRHAAFLLRKIGLDAAPRLIHALSRENSRVDQIAEALAQIGPPVVGLLAQSVKAPEPRVRRAAALALGQIRPLAPSTVPMLVVGLDDPDLEVKAAFLAAIRGIGPRAKESVPAVRALLQSPSTEIRLQVIVILAQSAPRDERLVGDLTDLLNDSDARVQRQAIDLIRALGPLGRPALPVVIGKLAGPDPEVRFAAAELIGTHGQAAAEAVPTLSSLLDDPTPKLRMIAVRTLGGLGKSAQPALDRLTVLLVDKQAEVREATVLALGSLELDAERIRPHLAKALRDDSSEVRRAASRAIQRQGSQGAIFLPDIILLAESKENFKSVERLLRSFERTGPDVRSLPELVNHLGHDQAAVRLLAIKFLGLAGQNAKDAIPALERLREDPSAEVRKQAEAACERIKNQATPSAS